MLALQNRGGLRAASHKCSAMKDKVAQLAPITGIASVRIPDEKWTVPNVEGKKASVAIYAHLAAKYQQKLTSAAAKEGLDLYDEVVADAVARPGAHPNIDLLLKVVKEDLVLDMVVDRQ